ncbi:hypothetical protein LNP24_25235 [Klebsiella pneumoniae subsp. pneumoniae]|nr:hypothetical protein [Klebsiella pneumoniae subsp. pneumoniae]
MTNTHETILLKIIVRSLKKGRLLTPSRYGQPKLAAGKKAKVTVRDITVCGFRGWRGGCDGLRSSASFRLILEKAAGFTNFAVKN